MSESRFVVHDGTSYAHIMTADEAGTLCEIPLPKPFIGKWYRSPVKAGDGLYPCQHCEEAFAGVRPGEPVLLLRAGVPTVVASVTVTLPGAVVLKETEVPASSLRTKLDTLMQRVGDRRVSVVVTSLEKP